MVELKTILSGVSDFFKAHLYPGLDAVNRAKISAALVAASFNPVGALTLLLCAVTPNTPVDKTLSAAKTFGILDDDNNVNPEALFSVAKAYLSEIGTYGINLFGIEFDVTAASIDALADIVRKTGR